MATFHAVQGGECAASIAAAYGFGDMKAVWQHADNEALRDERPNPNVLAPGDRVAVPEREPKEIDAEAGRGHRFKVAPSHRAGTGSRAALTFEVFLPTGHRVSGWELHGYDPECVPGLGVDGFALTFVSRVFPVNFPFFIDSATEGRFIELQARAEWDSGGAATEFAHSAVLNVPIRRRHAIVSTTQAPTGGSMSYTDDLVGNVVMHHESFLLQTARIRARGAWPATMNPEYVAIRPSQAGAFASYTSLAPDHQLRIFLEGAVADELLPDASDDIWTTAPLSAMGGATLRTSLLARVRTKIADTLQEVFVTDSGFTGGRVVFLDTAPASDAAIVATLTGTRPFTVPFFTYLVQQNNRLDSVAHAEEVVYSTTPSTLAGFDWLLPSPFPLGSGTKSLRGGIQFKSAYFSEHFSEFVRHPRRRGQPAMTVADVQDAAEKQAAKLAETVAHEIGHSLGLMHESVVGSWDEDGVGPLRSIMCSLTDAQPYGAGVRFSNQAKIIWRDAFGVAPNLASGSLVNKTWTAAEWRTVDWSDRIQRVMLAIGETSIARFSPDNNNQSPYTTMPATQLGTYVPPPSP